MKINWMLIAALASLMAAPLAVSAQSRDRDSRSNHGSDSRRTDRSGNENRRDGDRRDDRHSDNRRSDNGRDWRDSGRQSPTARQQYDNDRRADRNRNWDREQNWNRDRNRNWDNDRSRNRDRSDDHYYRDTSYVFRGSSRNEWRDIAVTFGAVSLLGLLDHDDFLTFSGSVGALYAIWRYDEDRSCSDPYRRARAHYFSLPYFYRDGCRFERRIVDRGGERYYQFVRCD
ncbi:MAG TPA: hypothetical protein VHE55_12730 [Fimbriimonadaceae bacterium]|nr:hypothetical protein [Fimbriimonadaceae bacterium]